MKRFYQSEIEGMVDFYIDLGIKPTYCLNTDGVINNNLIEFKKTKSVDGGIQNHIKQLKRYLKAFNSVAMPIPSISYLIYINSNEYIKIDNKKIEIIEQGKWFIPTEFIQKFKIKQMPLKGYIDEYSIVAYNNKFCNEFKKNATKEDVKKEFINPSYLWIKKFNWNKQITIEEKSRKIGWLHFNLNLLGNALLKKQLGAFFTPDIYVEKSTEYVRNAIKRSEKIGFSDYLIIDRCAGSGNLERKLTNEELSHCILNTIDYTEWTTLKGLYEGRARLIIPPTNKNMNLQGLLKDGNALSEPFNIFLKNYLKKYNLEKTYLIFLENPPFRDETSTLTNKDKKSRKKITYIDTLMNTDPKIKGAMKNELSLKFIWSCFEIYKPNEYILYSPIKYWKKYHLYDRKYFNGFITNRKDYNANYDAGLPIINWSSEPKKNEILFLENGEIKKIHKSIKTLLDKDKYKEYFAKMFIQAGELRPIGTSLDNGKQIINDVPCLINKYNILEQLAIWAAAKYEPKNLELNILMKSGDGGTKYLKDKSFLNDCFVWSCLSQKNKCISNDILTNEMAIFQNSLSDDILKKIKKTTQITKLLIRWKKILNLIKKYEEYSILKKYSLNQIEKEINIKIWNGSFNKKNEKIMEFKYPELRDQIKYIKKELSSFYKNNIEPKIFKYQLIK